MTHNSGTIFGNGVYPTGSNIQLSATPSEGFIFVGWMENGVKIGSEKSLNFSLTEDRTLVANFVNISEGQSAFVFPNPTSNILYLAGIAKSGSIQIVDLCGKIILEGVPNNNQINVGNLPKGLFLIRIQTHEGLVTRGFLKQ